MAHLGHRVLASMCYYVSVATTYAAVRVVLQICCEQLEAVGAGIGTGRHDSVRKNQGLHAGAWTARTLQCFAAEGDRALGSGTPTRQAERDTARGLLHKSACSTAHPAPQLCGT